MNSTTEPIMRVKDLCLRYKARSGIFKRFEHTALEGVTFDLWRGETLGILGRNGSGKSTLLRLLAGLVDPTSGEVVCEKGVRRALLALGLGFRPDLSGRDNALLSTMLQGASKSQAVKTLPEIECFSELGKFFDQPVKTYSSGMKARLGFATALMTKVDLMLIDETLSVGDGYFKKKAEKALQNRICGDQTVVLVSHSIPQVEELCDRVIWMENGVLRLSGDAIEVSNKYQESINSL